MSDERTNSTSQPQRPGEQNLMYILDLPDAERSVVQWLLRNGQANTATLAKELNHTEEAMQALLGTLDSKGFVEPAGDEEVPAWQAHVPPKRGRTLPGKLWAALE